MIFKFLKQSQIGLWSIRMMNSLRTLHPHLVRKKHNIHLRLIMITIVHKSILTH